MTPNEKALIIKIIQLTSEDKIEWRDASDAFRTSNYRAWHKGYDLATLCLDDEKPRIFIECGVSRIMICCDIEGVMGHLMSAIGNHFRRTNKEVFKRIKPNDEDYTKQDKKADYFLKILGH